jgi:hypothetical protein
MAHSIHTIPFLFFPFFLFFLCLPFKTRHELSHALGNGPHAGTYTPPSAPSSQVTPLKIYDANVFPSYCNSQRTSDCLTESEDLFSPIAVRHRNVVVVRSMPQVERWCLTWLFSFMLVVVLLSRYLSSVAKSCRVRTKHCRTKIRLGLFEQHRSSHR